MIKSEKKLYKNLFSKRDYVFALFTQNHQILIYKYVKLLRKEEKYYNKYKHSKSVMRYVHIVPFWCYRLRKNKIGNKLSIDIRENSCGENLLIYHPNIIINGHSKLGKNCILHGNNCIGNNGKSPKCPRIGNNVDIGYGAIIIGDVEIVDDVKIGAGAVVTKSVYTQGATIVGVPGREKGGK